MWHAVVFVGMLGPATGLILEPRWPPFCCSSPFGGKLYVEVPDQSDLYIPGHLWHFTGQTLRRWANALGLEEVQVDVRYPSSRSSRSGFTGSTFSPGLLVRSRK